MAQQPKHTDLKVTGKAGDHLCAYATQGPHKGLRFVKPTNGVWIPAGNASAEEMKSASLSEAFAGMFQRQSGAA